MDIIIWILILVILGMWFVIFSLWKLKILNTALQNELVKTKQQPIIIWKVTKYQEKDLDIFLHNIDIVELLISIYEYKIFKKTDTIRNEEDIQKKIWYLDWLHEMHLFFYKMKQKIYKKDTKTWQNLV